MSQIDSVRKKNITKSGCRVYADGFLGISGTLGEATEQTWAEAEANLTLQIPYPFVPEKNSQRTRDLRQTDLTDEQLINKTEALLVVLRERYPDFTFSNKVSMTETEISLKNDAGLDLISIDKTVNFGLLVKHKSSVNIFDTFLMRQDRIFDQEALLHDAQEMLGNFGQELSLPATGKVLVVMELDLISGKMLESLNGESVARGASLFCNKMGSKAFSDQFNYVQDRTAEKMHTPFFDSEGVQNPDDSCSLIAEGVILQAYSDKKNAAVLGAQSTGAAGGSYDETPSLGQPPVSISPGSKTLKELLNGEKALLIAMASGGDYTAQGDFASPVQLGMLTDGEHLLGRLPEFNIRGNLFELFGDDFIGVSSDKALFGERALVVRMQVTSKE
jgi:PmbA protein